MDPFSKTIKLFSVSVNDEGGSNRKFSGFNIFLATYSSLGGGGERRPCECEGVLVEDVFGERRKAS
jgi:hypothetical protein